MLTNKYDEELNEIESKMTELRKRRNDLIELKNADSDKLLRETFTKWRIKEDTYLAIFAEDSLSWNVAQCIHVKSVDDKKMTFQTIVTEYMNECGSQFVRVDNNLIRFETLVELSKNHHIYIVDRSNFMLLQHYFCNLTLTPETLSDYEQSVSEICLYQIS